MRFEDKKYSVAVLLTVLFLGIHMLCNFLPGRGNYWGIFHLSFFAWWQQALFIGLALLPLIFWERLGKCLAKTPIWLVLSFFAILFAVFPSRHILWGDGSMLIGQISGPLFPNHMEFGDTFVHQLFFRFLRFLGLNASGFQVYRWTSIGAGLILCGILYSWVKSEYQDKITGQFFILLFLGQGAVMLFFGHPESYSLFYISVLAFFLTAMRTLDGGKIIYSVLAAGAAVFLHLAGLSLLPLLSLLWLVSKKKIAVSLRISLVLLVASALGIFISALWLRSSGVMLFLPMLPDPANSYAVFSTGHLVDLFNMLGLLSPLAVILLAASGLRVGGDKKLFFLLISALILFLGMSVVDIVLEAADWDLFAFSLIPLFLLAFEAVRRQSQGKPPAQYAGLALAVMAFHTFPWIFSNASEDIIVREYSLIAARYNHSDRPRLFARATMALTANLQKNNDAAIYLGKEAIKAGLEDQRIWNNIGLAYYDQELFDPSAGAYKNVIKLDSGNAKAWGMLGTIYAGKGFYDSAAAAFQQAVKGNPDDAGSWHLWADALMKNGDLSGAASICREALTRWPDDGKSWSLTASCLLRTGSPEAVMAADKALELLPQDPVSYINAGIAHAVAKQQMTAVDIWKRGAALFPGSEKLRILSAMTEKEIQKEFNKK